MKDQRRAVCPVCFHHCRLDEGQYGRCRARKNINGTVVCDNYGKVTALALDPIEKKPLRHFMPGSLILSVGSYGCNLSCPFCQNHDISMGDKTVTEYREILPFTDAMNVDLKGFTEEYYRKLGGSLEAVKAFVRRAAEGCHVELTTLIVPGENDSEEEMEREAEWIASVDPEAVLHVTRFFPQYKMADRKATDVETVYRLRDVAARYLTNVYTGNC